MITVDLMDSSYFRAGVGIAVFDHEGLVLALERYKPPGAWQLPQGGIKEGEQPDDAALRELREETGLTEKQVKVLGRHPGWLAYELPSEARDPRLGRGQVHKWYVMALTAAAPELDLSRVDEDKAEPEFTAPRWMTFTELLSVAADFRVAVYRDVAQLAVSCGALAELPWETRRGRGERPGSRWTWRPSRTSVERLDAALASYSEALELKARRETEDRSWIGSVDAALDNARLARQNGRIEEAWASLKTAARLDVFGATKPELLARAEALRNEGATKLDGWRGQSVAALLQLDRPLEQLGATGRTAVSAETDAEQDEDLDERRWRVYQATFLRDEAGDNGYYKIALMREQRTLLLAVLAAVIVLLLILVTIGWLSFDEDPATPSAGLLVGVALFGMLGACLSAIRSMRAVPTGRIPEHTLASKLTITRPFIGAAAALGVFAILEAGFLQLDPDHNATLALAFSFAAGFSDRLVMGIIGSVKGP